jgi:nucleotide-binding universal stress UspA family protein
MKRILVPVDLSHGSENAIKIALRLSRESHSELDIINVVNGPRDAVLLEDGSVKEDGEFNLSSHKNAADKNLEYLEKEYGHLPQVNIEVKIGGVNEIILNALQAQTYDLMVLGMTGQLAKSFWSNSHTEYLSKHSNIPVFTLKCDRSNMSFDKILFVSDFMEATKLNLEILRSIAKTFDSEIVLLKVITDNEQRSEEEIINMANEFAQQNALENFAVCMHKADTIEEGIVTFSHQNNIDLISIGTHQRGGFSTLFKRSISQNIVRNLYHPIITIPIAEK